MKEDITVIKDCYLYKILDQNMYLSHGKCCKLRDKSGMYSLDKFFPSRKLQASWGDN